MNRPDLVGGFAAPYQPRCGEAKLGFKCFSHKRAVDVVPKYVNVTKVRKATGTAGTEGVDYTVDENATPYPRLDPVSTDNDCRDYIVAPGTCGPWLIGGDKNGLSAQLVTDAIEDIYSTGAGTDNDHNRYEQSDTKDLSVCHKVGMKNQIIRKHQHGMPGFDSERWQPLVNFTWPTGANTVPDPDSGTPVVATSPDQTNYLETTVEMDYDLKEQFGTVHSASASRTVRVNRLTGIRSVSGCTDVVDPWAGWVSILSIVPNMLIYGDWNITTAGNYILSLVNGSYFPGGTYTTANSGTTWTLTGGTVTVTVEIDYAGGHFSLLYEDSDLPGRTLLLEEIGLSATGMIYHRSVDWTGPDDGGADGTRYQFTCTTTHSTDSDDIYTAADCYADWTTAAIVWPLSDDTDYPFRPDEQLANAPLVVYDEVGPTGPLLDLENCSHVGTMENYDDPLPFNGDGYPLTFGQIDWLDPQSYVWKYPNGSYNVPGDWTGGATLLTGRRTGEIISRTTAGSDRHFWFNYYKLIREPDPDFSTFEWFNDTIGGFSEAPLPETAMRWMNNAESQYDDNNSDPLVYNHGNWPQAWLHQKDSILTGCKYIETKEMWPSVDWSRPCGEDKFAIKNITACCILEVDDSDLAAQIITVKIAIGSNVPGTTGGIQVADKVLFFSELLNSGIYEVTAIGGLVVNGDGVDTYAITVGPKLDDLPTGYALGDARDNMDWVASLRWWSAPGIAGRVAVTVTEASGTITIAASSSPYLRTSASVDLCDATMSVLATVTLTRVSDSSFTATHTAIPTAAWMVSHVLYDGSTPGTKYYFHENMPKRTYVHLEWLFNPRSTVAGWTGSTYDYADVAGCMGCTITEGCIPFTPCNPAVLGIMPASGSNVFPNAVLKEFPASFPFDDLHGAHWQAAIETTMDDPLWEPPFKASCDLEELFDAIEWKEDDGNGTADGTEAGGGGTIYKRWFAHRPLVEARITKPATFGAANNESPPDLPDGLKLTYDAANEIAPPYYPNGIPIGEDGSYGDVDRPYGLMLRADATIAAARPFAANYAKWIIS